MKRPMLIDSHCHLNYPGLVDDQADVVRRAQAAGVDAMISISTRRAEWADIIASTERYAGVYASVGVHPHEADQHADVTAETILAAANALKVVGIGETGLDYYYEHSDREAQQRLFQAHIEASRIAGLPLIVHTRDAEADTIRILQEESAKGAFPILIHCFSGSQHLADACIELGAYISLSGIVTFKSATDLRETVKTLPAERILVETDSPFLAPVPKRGKTCEPAFVLHTARLVAEIRNAEFADFAATTRSNTLALFTKMESACV